MPSDIALNTARAIAADRRGADHYRDVEALAEFLTSQFDANEQSARIVADAIAEDRESADDYADEQVLAGFLDGQFR